MGKYFDVFECSFSDGEVIKGKKIEKKYYGGRKKLIDTLMEEYPNKNILFLKMEKKSEWKSRFKGREIETTYIGKTERREIYNTGILIQEDKKVFNVSGDKKTDKLFIDFKNPVKETMTSNQILFYYDNDKKEWVKVKEI